MSNLNNTAYFNEMSNNNMFNIYNIDPNSIVDLPETPPQSPPPINIPMDYPIRPNFDFITDRHTRQMIESAYNAIARAEGWNLIRNFSGESFQFTQDPQLHNLMTRVHDEYDGGHSGSSMGLTMRHMQYIAKHGFESYRLEFIQEL